MPTRRASALLNSFPVMVLALLVLTSLKYSVRGTMTYSELDTLLYAKQFASPAYLPGEWYLNLPAGPRHPFHLLIYPLVRFFSLTTVSIAGRLLGYLLLSFPLALLARRLGLRTVAVCVALGAFLWFGQSIIPSHEWILKRIESKVVSYALLLLALHALMRKRLTQAGALAGLATTLHTLVGGWGTLALALTAGWRPTGPWRRRLTALAVWTAAASPALFYAATFFLQPDPVSPHTYHHIYVHFRNAYNLLPSQWDLAPSPLLGALLLLGCLLVAPRLLPQEDDVRLAAHFALFAMLPYLAGLLLSPFSFASRFLVFFPFRVGSTMVELFGLLLGIRLWLHLVAWRRLRHGVILVVAAYYFWISGAAFVKDLTRLRHFPRGAAQGNNGPLIQDLYQACDWVQSHTPEGSLFIASPSLSAFSYLCHRPVAVRFRNIPYTKRSIEEWYRRLIDFNGGQEPGRTGYQGSQEINRNFLDLSEEQYLSLARKYHGKYLLVQQRPHLGLPRVYDQGRWSIYWVGEDLLPPDLGGS